jgi:hypothetical protein
MTLQLRDCRSPWQDLYVHLNGDIKPCCYARGRLGSLVRGDTIAAVLDGDLRRELQDWTADNRIHPICAFAGCGYVGGRPADGAGAEAWTDATDDAAGVPSVSPAVVESAAMGHPQQMYMLASALWMARRAEPALKWFRRAAAVREVNSLLTLGDVHRNGWSLPAPDPVEARRLYEAGVALGHAPAMARLGEMLARGQGGPADAERGVALVREATKQGHKPAWATLADLIEAGLAPSRHPERDVVAYRERAA